MSAGYDGSIRIDTRLNTNEFNKGVKSIEKGLNSLIGTFKKLAVAAGLALSMKASISAAEEMQNAMMGLQSVMEGQGRSFQKAQKFINDYISDGLIPATQAVTAYKNLALRGYDDTQIKQVMVALKDSAAFGRQASYTLGEAVVTATEGLKNENSILVDNAGVTKNVAKMWDEYAKSIGTTANNLTHQQKIQAEVNGILEETKFQTGDAAKIAGSYSGQVLQLSFAFNNLKVAIGNALMPMLQKIIPPIIEVINWFTKLANVVAQVTAALFGKVVKVNNQTAKSAAGAANATSGLADAEKKAGNAAEKAGKQAKSALAAFDELNVLAQDTGSADTPDTTIPDVGGAGTDIVTEDIGAGIEVSPELMASLDRLKELLRPAAEAAERLWGELERLGGFVWDGLVDFYESFLVPVGQWVLGEGLPRFLDIITDGLSKVNWQKINDALHKLWLALTPFAIHIGEGLLWFLENVLVPLGVWTLNNIVPLVIEGIAAAINILNAAIDALAPLGIWLWEHFLSPIAEWTGGIIVSVLELLVRALEGVSNWIRENQEIVQAMTVVVGAFFAAWEATSLGVFIINAGGVVGALGKISAALYAATAAKVADQVVMAQLVLSYAKDFAMALASNVVNLAKDAAAWTASTAAKVANTAAQIAQTAAVTAWNAICSVATAVTTAFGAAVAFLTSPIGLVVVAITGLIAVIALLITNWDTVKEKALWVWEQIQEGWKDAATWFQEKVFDPFQKEVKKTGNFFIGIINGMISGFEGFVNFLIEGINKIIDGFNKIHFSIPDWVPGIGGKSWGFNLEHASKVSLGRVPKLATGAVIPPNQEFLAVLGDQKSGRNLEAPEGLIRQIMREELAGMMGSGDVNVTVEFTGSLAQLGRVLNPVITKEQKRIGKTLQTGGVL